MEKIQFCSSSRKTIFKDQVHGAWFQVKREKPETTNRRPETKSLKESGKRGRYAKVSVNNRGYTLLELLLSVFLIVIITAIVGGAIRLGYRSSDSGGKKIDSLERLRMSFRIIDAQIQSEIPLTFEGENGREFYFKGDEKSLQVSTNYSVWDGRRGYVLALYRIESDGYGKQFMHISENTIGSDSKRETKLFDALDDISFEYLKNGTSDEETWIPEWSETNNIPQKVRVHLVQGTKRYSMIIPMRARGTLIKSGTINAGRSDS